MLLAAFFMQSQAPARAVMIVIIDFEFQYRADAGEAVEHVAMSAKSRKPDTESFGIESSSALASSRLQTGLLPFLTTYFGPRTACAGLEETICRCRAFLDQRRGERPLGKHSKVGRRDGGLKMDLTKPLPSALPMCIDCRRDLW